MSTLSNRLLMKGYAALPILMATALVVTSGAIAASLITGTDQLSLQRQQEAAATRVEEAVMGFVLTHHRLPCPDSDSDGIENCSVTTQMAGQVPYRTLGLSAKQAINLTYVPAMGEDQDYNLTDSTGGLPSVKPPSDVVQIDLPADTPDLPSAFAPEPGCEVAEGKDPFDANDEPNCVDTGSSDLDPDELRELRELLDALQDYDNFWSDLIVNDATAVDDDEVLNNINESYITYYEDELNKDISITNEDGDEHDLEFPGSSLYESTQELLANLRLRRAITTARDGYDNLDDIDGIYDDVVDIQLLQSELLDVVTSGDDGTAQRAAIEDLRDREGDGWKAIVNNHNLVVEDYNDSNVYNYPDSSVEVSTPPLGTVAYDGGPNDLDTLDTESDDLPTLIAAMNEALTETGNEIQDNVRDLGQWLGDVAQTLEEDSEALKTDYRVAYEQADAEFKDYKADIAVKESGLGAGGVCDESNTNTYDSDACDDLNDEIYELETYRDEYLAARDFYGSDGVDPPGGLQAHTILFYDDFYCREKDSDDVCTQDGVQEGYTEAIERLSPDPAADPDDLSFDPDEEDPKPYDPSNDGDGGEDILPLLPDREFSTVTYPFYSNMADMCFKLRGIRSDPDGRSAIRYEQSSANGVPAVIIVEHGRNLRLDAENRLADNNGIFASPVRAHDLQYDDRVRPITADRLSVALGCTSLLQSYESFANVAEEIDLLYKVAADTRDGAIQDVTTNSINVALATMRLAVDTAAIAKDSAGGAAATAACVASLGLATNSCISAGFQFSAAIAHAATLVGSGIALAASATELGLSISDLTAAEGTLTDTVDHYALVILQARLADCRGGSIEAGEVGSAACGLD